MAATVLGEGIACELFDEINHIKGHPQVHLHFLTGDGEYESQGYGKVELCCHGCGESVLILFVEFKGSARAHVNVRNEFTKKHMLCENRGYEHDKPCPNYRSTADVLDLRQQRSRRRKSTRKTHESVRGVEVRREGESTSRDGSALEHGAHRDARLDERGPVRGG